MEKRYKTLRRLASLYFYVGAIPGSLAVIVGAIALVGGIASNGYEERTNGAFLLVGGLLFALAAISLSELIELLIATEENTRRTSVLLQRLMARRDGTDDDR